MIDYSILPDHMRDGARMYIEDGIEPGGFLFSVLANDFKGAVGRADRINRNCLFAWAEWVYNEVPHQAQGSEEKVLLWIKAGGINGLDKPKHNVTP